MKLKNKFALIIALTAFINFGGTVEAAEIDTELAIIAAEQDNDSGEFLAPIQKSEDDKKKLTEQNNSEPEVTSTVEEKVPEEKVPEEKVVEEKVVEEKVPEPVKAELPQSVEEKVTLPETEEISAPVGLPNPIKNYANFEELAQAVKFAPLYIPKKSGYVINEIFSISGTTAEIRYIRRWEPEVSLHVRTYKRAEGEKLQDISGIHGVKWRIDMTSGITVYIAKIEENSHVAAWSSGSYTFSAHVKNLSFAAFHSLVIDELVDLTTHYYLN